MDIESLAAGSDVFPWARTDPSKALSTLREAMEAFADTDLGPDQILEQALDQLMRVTEADAGALAVPSPDEDVELIVKRRLRGAGPISKTVLAHTLARADPQLVNTEIPNSASIAGGLISSILCTPVRRQGKTLAAVYLDRRGGNRPPFDRTAQELSQSFAAMLAITVDLTNRIETVETLHERLEERAGEAREIVSHLQGYWRFGNMTTNNPRFAQCLASAERTARYDVDVLILGETGTGKEHLARCVHEESARREQPFLAVNCTTLPEALAESELFGFEKGTFTGAERRHRGKIEQAAGGTLFLDEIGDVPEKIQPKLLRVIEEKKIFRMGGSQEIPVDVRIIAATNRNLEEEVKKGRFREDLYYRLNIVPLLLPPLRERPEDIPALADRFLSLALAQFGRTDITGWGPEARRRLVAYEWRGNVRELKNAIRRLVVLANGPQITLKDLALHIKLDSEQPAAAPVIGEGSLKDQILQFERALITDAIRAEGTVSGAARRLGLRPQSLHERCKKLELSPKDA